MKDSPNKVFAVEDDPVFAKMLYYTLSLNPDHEVYIFDSARKCLDRMHEKPLFITVDYSLPDMTGGELLKKIRQIDKNVPVVIISAQEDISTAVGLLKEGAYDYITKDSETKGRLLNTVNNILKNKSLEMEIDTLKQEISQKYDFQTAIIGNSPPMKKVFEILEKAIKTNITVSISGETGTGKEVVAKAIHYNSDRKKAPFVAVNVSAIPKDLIESELFGYEKGAFTGAVTRRTGKFEEAHKGTLFLDEIGDMDVNMQAKLLRVLQERQVSRIGGNAVTDVDVRILVATHKDLAEEVRTGNFREDLYYRLLGLPIKLPALRERGNDILLLAKSFGDKFAKDNKMPIKPFSREAQQKILKYPFPGNVRELKAVVELAAVMSNSTEIQADDISFNSVNKNTDFLMNEMTLKEYEYKIIKFYLEKYDENVIKVAEKLDIGKSTIYRHLKDINALEN